MPCDDLAGWASLADTLSERLRDRLVERVTVLADVGTSRAAPLRFRIERIVDTEPAWVAAVHVPASTGGLLGMLRRHGWSFWTRPDAIDWVTGRGLVDRPSAGRPVWATYRRPTADDVVAAVVGVLRELGAVNANGITKDVEWYTDEEAARRRAARRTSPQCGSRLGVGTRRPGAPAICTWCRRPVTHPTSVRGGLGTHCRRSIATWARQSGRPLSDAQLDRVAHTPRIPLHAWVEATPAAQWRRHLAARLP